jgi:lipopolysaccharide transport system permease protein
MRDIGQVMPIVLQFLYWFTPVVYMSNIIPEQYRQWLVFNPMYIMVEAFHSVMVYDRMPALGGVAVVGLLAVLLLLGAVTLFRKASPEMVDML